LDQRRASRYESARRSPKRFPECTRDHIHLPKHPELFNSPAPGLPQSPGRVRLVYKQKRVVFGRQTAKLGQWRKQAFHREHAVGSNNLDAIVLIAILLQHLAKVIDVSVAIQTRDGLLGDGAGKANAVDDARVVELVAVNHVLVIGLPEIIREQRGEESFVGSEA